jgi:transcriptional regulator with XRE-family HTH domain
MVGPDGRAIRIRRETLGVERTELAEKAGCSEIYLTHIEYGMRPQVSLKLIGRIARILGTDVGKLTKDEAA